MRVRISSEALASVRAHAASAPGLEVCGLLFGGDDMIERARAAANVAENPVRRFEIDPAVLFAAIRAERGGGPRLIGYYHSHPTGDAAASNEDQARANGDGKLWMIVAGPAVRLYRATDAGLTPIVLSLDRNQSSTPVS